MLRKPRRSAAAVRQLLSLTSTTLAATVQPAVVLLAAGELQVVADAPDAGRRRRMRCLVEESLPAAGNGIPKGAVGSLAEAEAFLPEVALVELAPVVLVPHVE